MAHALCRRALQREMDGILTIVTPNNPKVFRKIECYFKTLGILQRANPRYEIVQKEVCAFGHMHIFIRVIRI